MARQKLKLAEALSDVNSYSDEERQEKWKKSRKDRAAKAHDSSSYEYSEHDDNCSDEAMLLQFPKAPAGKLPHSKERFKGKAIHTQKGENTIKY